MRDRKPTDLRDPETERLRDDLLKDQWMWNYSWRGVKLAYLEKAYGVPPAEILSIMRDIARKYDPPNADKLPDSRCTSCGMRIIWGKQNEKPHPLDPKILNVLTAQGTLVRGRESHFVSCPNANNHRKSKEVS